MKVKYVANSNEFLYNKNANYQILVSRKTSPLLRFLFVEGLGSKKNYKKKLGYEFSHNLLYLNSDIYQNIKQFQEELDIILKKQKENKDFLLSVAENCERDGNLLMDFSREIRSKDYLKLNISELKKIFQQFYDRLVEFSTYTDMPLAIQTYLTKLLEGLLKEVNLSKKDYERYYSSLATPIKTNTSSKEYEDFLKVAITPTKAKIKSHLKKYDIMGSKNGTGELWSEKDILARIESIENPKKKLKGIKKLSEHNEECITEFSNLLSTEQKRILKIVRTYIFIRTFRTDVISGSFANIIPLLTEIAKRNEFSLEEILQCLVSEVLGKLPSKSELKDRDFFVLVNNENIIYYAHGKQAEEIYKDISKKFEKNIDNIIELKGQVAFKGIVKGKVRLVKNNHDIKNFKKGEVLVTAMTTPNFIPAMEKAAAFVTDEGGILCHAAIISREMNKPCIIGTKHATKILKDGDLVEVDADKGIVRKITL